MEIEKKVETKTAFNPDFTSAFGSIKYMKPLEKKVEAPVLSETTYIDPKKHTVKEIMQIMMLKAYRGKPPQGGFEVPSNTMLKAVPEQKADYIVSQDLPNSNLQFSEDMNAMPMVFKQERIPKQSTGPFEDTHDDYSQLGIMAKPFQSHMKLKRLLMSENRDTKNLDNNFKAVWGLDRDTDLDNLLPKLRSEGPAKWGGVNRKTVPVSFALPNVSQTITVVEKGTSKLELGKNSLVDWPKAKSSAIAVATQVFGDDKSAIEEKTQKKLSLYYKIEPRNLPVAPVDVSMPMFPEINKLHVKNVQAQISAIIFQSQKIVLARAQKIGNVSFNEVRPKMFTEAVRQLERVSHSTEYEDMDILPFLKPFDGLPEIEYPEPEVKTVIKREPDVFHIFKLHVIAKADSLLGNVPRAVDFRERSLLLELNDKETREWVVKQINYLIPKDFMYRLRRFGDFLATGKGQHLVLQFKKEMQIRRSLFQEMDLEKVWQKSLESDKTLIKLSNWIVRALSKYEFIMKQDVIYNRDIFRDLADNVSVELGISKLIRRHQVYWHNRYLRKKPVDDIDRVRLQLLAKIMIKSEFIVGETGELEYKERPIYFVLAESAERYLAKRSGSEKKFFNIGESDDYAKEIVIIDNICDSVHPLKLKYQKIYEMGKLDLALFCNDMINIMQDVLEFDYERTYEALKEQEKDLMNSENWNFGEHVVLSEKIEKVEQLMQKQEQEQVVKDTKKEVQEIKKEPDILPSEKFMADEDDDDDEITDIDFDFDANKDQTVDLIVELTDEDSRVDVTHPIVKEVLKQYPQRVHWSEVDKIREKILKAFAKQEKSQK